MRHIRNSLRQWPLALLCGALMVSAQAAGPLVTDDASIVDPGACQLETWFKRNRDSSETWLQSACNPTGNLELTLGGARTSDAGGTRTSDLVVQLKTIVKPLETNGWGWGLAFGSNRQPDPDGTREWYATLPLSVSFDDDRLLLHANLGWLREQEQRRDRLTWGVATEKQLDARNWLIAEVFGQHQGRPYYQFGLRHWLLPERAQIDLTYGNRFGRDDAGHWLSIGLRLLSPAFLH
ncbi:MAG: hypothetical protein WBG17_03315 [Burkholderiaceae bacterium]